MSQSAHVLIVEDESDLAALYATWLPDEFSVTTTDDGNEALALIDDSVDVVLLDRRMPALSGDSILGTIRERELDCRIAMVTAVEPDFGVIEMGFDEYLVKPVSKADIRSVVDQLLLRSTYDDQLQEYFSLAAKKALLDTEKTDAELKAHSEYAALEDQLAVLRASVDDTLAELFDQDVYRRLCRDITGQPSTAPK